MRTITIAKGDGIGPEIMNAVLYILTASNAQVKMEEIEVGEKRYMAGESSGIDAAAWESIRRTKVFLKAPITTPQGGGYKSLNVTMRKALGLYANVRPCKSFYPFVKTKHPEMDLVIIRENEEDLYAGIEHQQTDEVVQCLKLISRPGCEKIIRFAFEYARHYGRKRVSCFTKDNIMKQTDGLFHQVFREVAAEYPDISNDHFIIDIGTARLADTPEAFDVIVTPNLYGDILSDVAAQVSGSVGLAGSANLGEGCAMFEAVHGSAPDIAGKDIANPSGLLRAAVMLLHHIGENQAAENIKNAWLYTLESGIHTPDIFDPSKSRQKVGTRAFAEAVAANLGKKPQQLEIANYSSHQPFELPVYLRKPTKKKELKGVDIFVDWKGNEPNSLAEKLAVEHETLNLVLITNRGVKVWPDGMEETFLTDHWRCRFQLHGLLKPSSLDILTLCRQLLDRGVDIIKTENLYDFDGVRGYSLGQGQ